MYEKYVMIMVYKLRLLSVLKIQSI